MIVLLLRSGVPPSLFVDSVVRGGAEDIFIRGTTGVGDEEEGRRERKTETRKETVMKRRRKKETRVDQEREQE